MSCDKEMTPKGPVSIFETSAYYADLVFCLLYVVNDAIGCVQLIRAILTVAFTIRTKLLWIKICYKIKNNKNKKISKYRFWCLPVSYLGGAYKSISIADTGDLPTFANAQKPQLSLYKG